ncbi:MAG: hypothetical protein K5656_03375 [Lachnospiraceae bacterium]|nr:hypothetical protein [Lachnospiraceae bacterium]
MFKTIKGKGIVILAVAAIALIIYGLGSSYITKAEDLASSNAASNNAASANSEATSEEAATTEEPKVDNGYIGKLGLSTFAKNKKYTGKYRLYIKDISRTYKLKGFNRVRNAKGKGVDKITFDYVTTLSYKMNKSFVNSVAKAKEADMVTGNWYYAVIDNKTGKCIEEVDTDDIEITSTDWKYSKYQKVSTKTFYCDVAMKAKTSVTMYIPSDQVDNIAIIAGVSTIDENTKADKKFWKGKKKFATTSMYKKYSKYARATKLSDLI